MSEIELLEKAKLARQVGADVEIVGAWIWAHFDSKPPKETRIALLAAGYHWNFKRGVWQFAGVPCRHSVASTPEVKAKYGARELEEVIA